MSQCPKANLFFYNLRKTKINEDWFSVMLTKDYIVCFDVEMYDLKFVHKPKFLSKLPCLKNTDP